MTHEIRDKHAFVTGYEINGSSRELVAYPVNDSGAGPLSLEVGDRELAFGITLSREDANALAWFLLERTAVLPGEEGA